jgi:hypothetical protein
LVVGLVVVATGCGGNALAVDSALRERIAFDCEDEAACTRLSSEVNARLAGCGTDASRCDALRSDSERIAASLASFHRRRLEAANAAAAKQRENELAHARAIERERSAAARLSEESVREKAAAEAQRDAEIHAAQAAFSRTHRILGLAEDPAYFVPVLSAMLCRSGQRVATLNAELQRERSVEARGGIIDVQARRQIAEGLQSESEYASAIRKALAARQRTPRSCQAVADLIKCRDVGACEEKLGDEAALWRSAELERQLGLPKVE